MKRRRCTNENITSISNRQDEQEEAHQDCKDATRCMEVKKMELEIKHIVYLQALDVITTYIGLTFFGLTEINPISNGLFQEYGFIGTLIIGKVILLGFVYGCFYCYTLKIKKLAINIICFVFIAVFANNIIQIVIS